MDEINYRLEGKEDRNRSSKEKKQNKKIRKTRRFFHEKIGSLILASLVLLGVLAPMSYAEEVAPKAAVIYYTKYVETSGVKR